MNSVLLLLYRFVLGIALATLFGSSLTAQTRPREVSTQAQTRHIDSGIDLVVTDQSGAVVQNAQVLVQNQEGKKIADGKTDAYGRFRVSNLTAAEYVISTQASGFKISRQPVIVPRDDTAEITVALQAAGTIYFVEVPGPAVVEVDSALSDKAGLAGFAPELQRRPQQLLLEIQSARPESH
jgi:hypothetical protein